MDWLRFSNPRAPKPKAPSPEQMAALRMMAEHGHLLRLPGGFWTVRGIKHTRWNEFTKREETIPEWYVAVGTARAMEKRGWIRRTNTFPEEWRDERELTEVGRALVERSSNPIERDGSALTVTLDDEVEATVTLDDDFPETRWTVDQIRVDGVRLDRRDPRFRVLERRVDDAVQRWQRSRREI